MNNVDGYFITENLGVAGYEVFVEHVEEFRGEFDAGWTAAADNKTEEVFALFIGGGGETSAFKIFDYFLADFAGIGYVFEVVDILEAGDAVSTGFGA